MISYSSKQILKKILKYLFLAVFLFVFTIEGSVANSFGLIVIILSTSISGLIAGILHGKFTHPRTLLTSKIVLFVGLFVIIASYSYYKIQINQNFKNTAILIKSIDKYKKEHSDYPKTMDALVPKYIDKIPNVKVGVIPRSFSYEYIDINDKVLKKENQISQSANSEYFLTYIGYLGNKYTYYSREGYLKLAD
jgi:hypothetical protein